MRGQYGYQIIGAEPAAAQQQVPASEMSGMKALGLTLGAVAASIVAIKVAKNPFWGGLGMPR